MKFSYLDIVLWISDATLALLALVALIRTRQARNWPFLCAFLVIFAGSEIAQAIAIQAGYRVYFYVYWIDAGLKYAAQFGVLYEVCSSVLKTFPYIPKSFSKLLATLVVIAALTGIAVSMNTATSFSDLLLTLFVGMQRTALMAWCAAFIACAIATSRLGLGWPSNSILIGGGAAAMNSAGMIASVLFGILSIHRATEVDHVQSAVNIAVLFLWSACPRTESDKAYLPNAETVESVKAIAKSTLGSW